MSYCGVEKLTDIFSNKLLLHIDSPDADLLSTGILDSMTLVELLLNIEQEFCIRVKLEETDLDNFRSFQHRRDAGRSAQPIGSQWKLNRVLPGSPGGGLKCAGSKPYYVEGCCCVVRRCHGLRRRGPRSRRKSSQKPLLPMNNRVRGMRWVLWIRSPFAV